MALPPKEPTPTAERLLDAAETLFGQRGLEGTSIREIAKLAQANLAAAHYHFGSKETLYAEVFFRRVRPINDQRLHLLGQATARGPGNLEGVVSSFVRPALEAGRRHPNFLCLLGRNLVSPPAFFGEIMSREFAPLVQAYRPALQAELPHLPPPEVFWRMNFLVGSLLYTMAHFPTIERMAGPVGTADPVDLTCRRLTQFACAGLRSVSIT